MKSKRLFVCVLVTALTCVAVLTLLSLTSGAKIPPQNSSTSADFSSYKYDTVSIKPFKADPNARSRIMGGDYTPDGYSAKEVPLTFIIYAAYRTAHMELSGAPAWLNTERYDVEAKMDPDTMEALKKLSSADQKLARKHMMQALVQDRLKLAIHMDTKEVSVYELVIAKNGTKLKEITNPTGTGVGLTPSRSGGAEVWTVQNTELATMIGQLSYTVGRPVFDKTGLTGNYTFTMKFTAEQSLSAGAPGFDGTPLQDSAPPIDKALEEQLGLKLVSTKGRMDVVVIDHVERPTAN